MDKETFMNTTYDCEKCGTKYYHGRFHLENRGNNTHVVCDVCGDDEWYFENNKRKEKC